MSVAAALREGAGEILTINENLRRAIAAARRIRDAFAEFGDETPSVEAPARPFTGPAPWALGWESPTFTQPTRNGPNNNGGG